jgi:choline dehydrogenase-like flavoprotein
VIRDVAQLEDGTVVRGDIAVVGAGLAGVELTRHLGRHGLRVVLLESGRLDFDPRTQELVRTESVGKPIREPDPEGPLNPYLPPAYRGESRIRQFGGTSNAWTGKWRTFDPFDFEERTWVPHSGWPISFEDLRPHYDAVRRDYALGDFEAPGRSEAIRHLRKIAGDGGLKLSFHVWQRQPLRARDYSTELSEARNVDVVLGANATEIVLSDDLRRVRAVVCRSLDGHRFEVEAQHFVLATGGREEARLLLASNRQIPAGIGNERDLVGRFYMDHFKHKLGVLRPSAELGNPPAVGTAKWPKPRFHTTFSLSEDVQRERSLLAHAIRFNPVYRYDVGYPGELVEEIREALRTRSARKLVPSALRLARSPADSWKVAQKRWHRGRGGPLDHYRVTMYAEQVPNPNSRLCLGRERDALGVPRLVADWRPTPLDHESFRRTLQGLTDAFASAGLGHLDFGPRPLTLDDTWDAAHPMGATRMAATPAEGVVDSDCRVFGTENLFIASSAVFPTGHSTAPTFTIVALARRLGVHLLALCARRGPTHRASAPPPAGVRLASPSAEHRWGAEAL